MEAHPYADLFPMMTDDELQVLAADIKVNGQTDDIVTYEGMILDGRNRYRACQIAGVEPMTRGYLENDPLGFVFSRNLHRRHLTESQRASLAAKMATLRQGERKDLKPANLPVMRQVDVAEMLGVSERSVRAATSVLRNGVPELVGAVEAGKVTVNAAAEVAKLPRNEQSKIVAQGPEAVKEAAKNVKAERKPKPNNPTPKPVDDLQFVKSKTNRISLHELLGRIVQRIKREPDSAKSTIRQLREAIEKIEAIQKGNN